MHRVPGPAAPAPGVRVRLVQRPVSSNLVRAIAIVWLASSITYLQLTDFSFTPDSYAYVAAAGSIAEQGNLTVPFAPSRALALPVPYTAWPPGYPLTIALVHALGPDTWTAARLVSMVGLLAALLIFARMVRPLPGGDAAIAVLLISLPTALIAVHAWSEGTFAALLSGCLWAAHRFRFALQPRIGHLVLALACAGAACLFRYAGLFLLPPLLYLAWRSGFRIYRIVGTLGALLASLPIAVWLWRNAQLGVTWRGAVPHPPEWWRAPAEFCRALGEMSFAPVGLPSWIQAVSGAALIIVTIFVVRANLPRLRASPAANTASIFLVFFVVGIVLARGGGVTGVLVPRLIWPVLPFAALLLGALLNSDSSQQRRTIRLLLVALLLVQSISVLLVPRLQPSLERRLASSALPAFLDVETAVLANRGWEAWRQTRRPTYYVPLRPHDDQLLGPDTLAAWAERRGVRYLVWFDEGSAPESQRAIYGDLYDAAVSGDARWLELAWRADSVAVYRIRPGH